jgi:ATP-dependent RNA helicase HelY
MKLLALGTSGRTVPLGKREIVAGTNRRATVALPQPMDTKSRRFQSDALRLLRKVPATADDPVDDPAVEIDHPVASCPDRDSHLRWAARAERTQKRVEGLRSELRRSGIGLVEDFEAIERLLAHFGYMSGWALTPRGERLRFVYNELDLLLAEALERGLFYGLTVPELAALASCFVYEPRSDEKTIPLWPTPELARRWETLVLLSSEIVTEERRQHLPATREPDPGFVGLAFQWADGSALDDLTGLRLAPGDFVRVARQLVDLLRQIRDVSPEVADVARDTLAAVDRGVVAAMGVG